MDTQPMKASELGQIRERLEALRAALRAEDIKSYVESREQVKQSIVTAELLKHKRTPEQENPS